jgi:hypothetical protein
VNEALFAALCAEMQEGGVRWSRHYALRLFERSMPDRQQIRYLLCEDDAEIIERYANGRGRSCLIWGIMQNGRVGHVQCSYPPGAVVVTAYWPDTEPEEWADNYKRRTEQS